MGNYFEVVNHLLTTNHLIVYKSNGNQIVILQGDPRVRKIIEYIQANKSEDVCLVPKDLFEDPEDPSVEAYKKMEETSGIVKFFRIAKDKVMSVLGLTAKTVPTECENQIIEAIKEPRQLSLPLTQEEKVAEIMSHAKTLKRLPKEDSGDIVIGVIGDTTIIPNIQKLNNHIHHVNENPDRAKGMNLFLGRLAEVIEKRHHNTQDILDFVEKNNMPIADDGSIIVFKRVYSTKTPGVFVDCHSRSVEQRVGDVVRMDISKVDPDRYVSCSTGLHVARWDYLRSFVGDALLICKLFPEHIIAVPHGDTSKVRASEYTILGEITGQEYSNVINNRDGINLTEEGKQILAAAVKGDMDPESPGEVFIDSTGLISYTPGKKVEKVLTPKTDVKTVDEVPVNQEPIKDTPVNVREYASTKKPTSRKETMQSLISLWERTRSNHDLRKIRDFKRKSKSSWKTLGVDKSDEDKLNRAIKNLE